MRSIRLPILYLRSTSGSVVKLTHYIGRFAPSPSGPLHFGSLIAALASYLDAKANKGKWLLRIENIDPPREIPDADKIIQSQLHDFGLNWDETVLYQNTRLNVYQAQLENWIKQNKAFYCQCTRKMIKANGGFYAGTCRTLQLKCEYLGQQDHVSRKIEQGKAIRFLNNMPVLSFQDRLHQTVSVNEKQASDDFILFRRDGLFAYQLAVVMDDIIQNVDHIVRGQDLIETTVWQLALYQALKQSAPRYLHLPLIVDKSGRKLSKQNGAPAITRHNSGYLLQQALTLLGQNPPHEIGIENNQTILKWAIEHWQPAQIPKNNVVYN